MPTPESVPRAAFLRLRLAQIARLVVLQRPRDPLLAAQPPDLLARAIEVMIRDCLALQVPSPALLAATDGACWIGEWEGAHDAAA